MTTPAADGAANGMATGRPPTERSRRRQALILVGLVLALGLAYEFIRFDHHVFAKPTILVVGGVLVIGIVVALVDPGPSRIGRTVAGVALAAALVLAIAQLRTSTDPLVGDWTAGGDGLPSAAVAITHSPAGYTVRTMSTARLPGSTCDLPPGAVIATFTGTATGDHGQQLVSSPGSCVSGWETATFGLDPGGATLHREGPQRSRSRPGQGAVNRVAARLRRHGALLLVAAVLLAGLTAEFVRYRHAVAGHWPAVVVAGLLTLGLVLGVVVPGLSRVGRVVVGLSLSVGLLFTLIQLRVVDPLVGDWNVTFGAPATVTIARVGDGSYTMTARTPLRVHTSATCDLAPGTVIADFSGAAPTYAGRLGRWNVDSCQFADWSPTTFTLGDGTLDTTLADGERFVLVRPDAP